MTVSRAYDPSVIVTDDNMYFRSTYRQPRYYSAYGFDCEWGELQGPTFAVFTHSWYAAQVFESRRSAARCIQRLKDKRVLVYGSYSLGLPKLAVVSHSEGIDFPTCHPLDDPFTEATCLHGRSQWFVLR